MATLHWNGDTDTDLNKPANYVDDGAGGSNQITAFTGSDPANDDIVLQSSAAANVCVVSLSCYGVQRISNRRLLRLCLSRMCSEPRAKPHRSLAHAFVKSIGPA